MSLVYRGEQKNAAMFIEAQEKVLVELYPPVEEENSSEQAEENEESEAEESESVPAESEVE